MSLKEKIAKSTILMPPERLVLGLLSNEKMTTRQLVDCLMSDPYNLDLIDIFRGLDGLNEKGLIRIDGFRLDLRNINIETQLTYVVDWVRRL